ncbi:hypothetical protein PV04_07264 [Phialophora macrospora]|uniref:Tho complex subunit 7 n=1 Tax=Phialophora macrospora TaxID=1851006 RepID=A0A0D2FDS2_9EURO|nr:hypothetical protein PV04_07264 [Phialophora macrospora]
MATFTVLDQAEEDKLHATRLLGIEERPYKRVSKRLLAPTTPITSFLSRPSPSNDDAEAADQNEHFLQSLARFREDIILDFAAFESSIARIQFLRAANTRERERYAAEKLKIEQTANDVRENLGQLRVQLDEAQKTLAVRKTYDVLAEKITRDEKLKVTRAEQHANIEKLRSEIEELERESGELKSAWSERREQLQNLMGEGMRLRRIIRDEKEPDAETDHHGDEDGEDGERERDGLSNMGTPRPMDDAPTPRPSALRGSGALTPRSHVPEGGTPGPTGDEDVNMDGGAMEAVPTENVVAAGDVDKPANEHRDDMDTS